jgi:hypothetical protein
VVDLVEQRTGNGRRHHAAVANTLAHADDAAREGDFAAALSWLEMLEALNEEIPDAFRIKRHAWTQALR